MKCIHCGVDNPDEALFCGACGSKIGSTFDSPAGPVTDLGSDHEPESTFDDPNEDVLSGQPVVEAKPDVPAPPSFSEPVPIPTRLPDPPAPPTPPVPPVQQPPPVNPNAPGAGIAPPPGTYQQQPPPPYQQGGQQPGYGAPQGYGYSMPPDGNTSGMGESYPVPPQAEGWSFAGFIPWGLFSFINGNTLWGILWWVSSMFGLGIIYVIFVGLNGKKQAWQGRRFDSIYQFEDTMKAWNTWGIVTGIVGVIFWCLYMLFFVSAFMVGFSEAMSEEMGTPSGF